VKATHPATTAKPEAPKPEAALAATGSVVWINGPERQKDGSMAGDFRLRLPEEAMKAAVDAGLTVKLRKDVGPSGQSIGHDVASP